MTISNRANNHLIQPKRIRNLFTQCNLGSIYLSSILEFLHILLRFGMKPKTDGWRKYTAAFLRTEDSRFLLSVFRLKVGLNVRDNGVQTKAKQ